MGKYGKTGNMDNVDNMDDTVFTNNGVSHLQRQTTAPELSADFENRVFAKIKKRKVRRKATASITLSLAVVGFLFVAGGLFVRDKTDLTMPFPQKEAPMLASAVDYENGNTIDNYNDGLDNQWDSPLDQESGEAIPVTDDVVFASSDTQADYAIEQVAYYEDENSF